VGNGHYNPINVVSDALRASLENLRTQYLIANAANSPDAGRRMNSWQGNFENAINGARTVQALEQLQTLLVPTPRLARKLNSKLATLRGTIANVKEKQIRRSTPPLEAVKA
jgi:hypothetical protein